MAIKDIFGKFKIETVPQTSDEDYIELDMGNAIVNSSSRVMIVVEKLEDFGDADRIQQKVRNGNIVFVNIKDMKEKDISELKRAIARIRKTTLAISGDIAGISEDWIICTPSYARIHRSEGIRGSAPRHVTSEESQIEPDED